MKRTIVIEEDLWNKAKDYSKKTGRTFSGLIEICLRKILEEKEDELL